MLSRLTLVVLCLAGCGVPLEAESTNPPITPEPATSTKPAGPEHVTLTLETRSGDSSRGYSFAEGQLVDTAAADLHLNAFDCGARGRWIAIMGSTDIRFCATGAEVCDYRLAAGGTDPAFEGEVIVKKGDQVLGRLKLIAHSPTPDRWYEQSPIPAYEATLDITR